MGDFETLKYDVFFNENHRTKEENKEIDIKNVINEVLISFIKENILIFYLVIPKVMKKILF